MGAIVLGSLTIFIILGIAKGSRSKNDYVPYEQRELEYLLEWAKKGKVDIERIERGIKKARQLGLKKLEEDLHVERTRLKRP